MTRPVPPQRSHALDQAEVELAEEFKMCTFHWLPFEECDCDQPRPQNDEGRARPVLLLIAALTIAIAAGMFLFWRDATADTVAGCQAALAQEAQYPEVDDDVVADACDGLTEAEAGEAATGVVMDEMERALLP